MSRNYNETLEDDALGRKGITFTRDESNMVARGIGFPNRVDQSYEIRIDLKYIVLQMKKQ